MMSAYRTADLFNYYAFLANAVRSQCPLRSVLRRFCNRRVLTDAREKRRRLQILRHLVFNEAPLRLVLRPHEPPRPTDNELVDMLDDFARLHTSEIDKAGRIVGGDE